MGGFAQVYLRDRSAEGIAKANQSLAEAGLRKALRFYSEDDVRLEYDYFARGEGYFPADQFPKDKIKSFEDFKKYWNPQALGDVFCPPFGVLQFDCYFGRTSKRAMRIMGRWIADNHRLIEKTSGSFTTFMERGMTKLERQIMKESDVKVNW